MKFRKFFAFTLGFALPYAATSTAANAGEFYFPVKSSEAKEYSPKGFEIGNMDFLSSLKVGAEYDDNIYATDTNTRNDLIGTLRPSLNAKSDFEHHEINFGLSTEKAYYDEYDNEDYLDYTAGLGGRIDLNGQNSFPLRVEHRHAHYDRTSPEDFGGIEPTEYDRNLGQFGFEHDGATVSVRSFARFEDYDFEDARNATGGIINNDEQDRRETTYQLEVGLSKQGRIAPFAYTNYKTIDFDQRTSLGNFDRDATNNKYGLGVDIALSNMTKARISGGYVQRDNDDNAFKDRSHLNYSAAIDWAPSPLLNVTFMAQKLLDETALSGSSVSVDHRFSTEVDYEWQPQIALNGAVEYQDKDYEGLLSQSLKRFGTRVGATYKLNPSVWFDATHRYTHQEADSASPSLRDFDRNQFMLSTSFFY